MSGLRFPVSIKLPFTSASIYLVKSLSPRVSQKKKKNVTHVSCSSSDCYIDLLALSRRVFQGLCLSVGHVFFIAHFIGQGFIHTLFETTDLFGFHQNFPLQFLHLTATQSFVAVFCTNFSSAYFRFITISRCKPDSLALLWNCPQCSNCSQIWFVILQGHLPIKGSDVALFEPSEAPSPLESKLELIVLRALME